MNDTTHEVPSAPENLNAEEAQAIWDEAIGLLARLFPIVGKDITKSGRIYLQTGGEPGEVPSIGFIHREIPAVPGGSTFVLDVTVPMKPLSVKIDDLPPMNVYAKGTWKELYVMFAPPEEEESD